MDIHGPNAGRLGLAFLAGLAGAFIISALAKPRALDDSRFLRDYPAYSGLQFPKAEVQSLKR
jgi:hypothetical protein